MDEFGNHTFLIKWCGYRKSQSTWEPEDHLDSCAKILSRWRKSHSLSTVEKNLLQTTDIPGSYGKKRKMTKSIHVLIRFYRDIEIDKCGDVVGV